MLRLSTLAAATALACSIPSQAAPATRLHVAFVAAKDDALASELRASLKKSGMRIRLIAPKDCRRESWWQADVVVVSWPANMPVTSSTPLARWDRPTVFIGDTGDRFAELWDLPTAKQTNVRLRNASHELEQREFLSGDGPCTRQGNLVHLPRSLPKQRVAWLADCEATVRWAAHFRSDRPMLRIVRDKQRIEAERQRVSRMHKAAVELDVEVDVFKSLLDLPNMLLGSDQEQAEALLVDLFPGGPGAGATRNDWMNWMRTGKYALRWDGVSEVWHFDHLLSARGHRSNRRLQTRGDGLKSDPRAVALARKVVDHYGGRALDDLATFSCTANNVHYMWDRRRGYFRMENHSPPPAEKGHTLWCVGAMDTATGEQTAWDPARRVGALSSFRSVIERLFLPLMLLEPGVTLRLLDEEGDDKTVVLSVRLAGRNMNHATDFRLSIDRKTGAVQSMSSAIGGHANHVFTLKGTVTCGPLRLPGVWEFGEAPNTLTITTRHATWNPTLPEGMETATERLTIPRPK